MNLRLVGESAVLLATAREGLGRKVWGPGWADDSGPRTAQGVREEGKGGITQLYEIPHALSQDRHCASTRLRGTVEVCP